MTIDISPLYDIIDSAIDRVGVMVLYFMVFDGSDLNWWFLDHPEEEKWDCWKTHGSNDCDEYEPWWFFHYIGVITADKLLRERKEDDASNGILWDAWTGERVTSAAKLLQKIHTSQESLPLVDDMSFHAEHAIIWHYVVSKKPNMKTFPAHYAKSLCGSDNYAFEDVQVHPATKYIGYECFHGFGHAAYYAVARRQVLEAAEQQQQQQQQQQAEKGSSRNNQQHQHHGRLLKLKEVSAKVQFRPSAGLVLTPKSWCDLYELCHGAATMAKEEGYAIDVEQRCMGGAEHSLRIFSPEKDKRWHSTVPKAIRNQHFADEIDRCRRRRQ